VDAPLLLRQRGGGGRLLVIARPIAVARPIATIAFAATAIAASPAVLLAFALRPLPLHLRFAGE
jgi:hypothetical protein